MVFAHVDQEVTVKPHNRQRKPRPGDKELSRMRGQIGKLGANLNQLTQLAHAGCHIDPVELAALREATEDLRDVIRAALKDA